MSTVFVGTTSGPKPTRFFNLSNLATEVTKGGTF